MKRKAKIAAPARPATVLVSKAKKSIENARSRSADNHRTMQDAAPDFCEYEWLELHPKGIIFEGGHFVFILQDEAKKSFLPLRFPLESADLLGVPNLKSLWKKSITTLNESLFKAWDIQLNRCAFVKHASGRHRVKLFYSKDGKEAHLEQDLENVLGFCLEGQLPFYATRAYIQDSQIGQPANENFIINQKWTGARQKYLM